MGRESCNRLSRLQEIRESERREIEFEKRLARE